MNANERKSEPTFVPIRDRKSTRLNSSHSQISYAVFCLKKKSALDSRKNSAQNITQLIRRRADRKLINYQYIIAYLNRGYRTSSTNIPNYTAPILHDPR